MEGLERYREKYDKARAAVDPEIFEWDAYHWVSRVATWEDFQEPGAFTADLLRRAAKGDSKREREKTRALAPELYDLVLEAYPAPPKKKGAR